MILNRGRMYRELASILGRALESPDHLDEGVAQDVVVVRDRLLLWAAEEDGIAVAFSESQPSLDSILEAAE